METKEVNCPEAPTSLLDGELQIQPNGLSVLQKRYLLKGDDGNPVETVPQMFWRVASWISAHTLPKSTKAGTEITAQEVQDLAVQYYRVMSSLKFFPNSPTFSGSKTPLGQLAACFVLAVDDDMGKDSDQGIFSTLRSAALIQQTGGGVGFDFSRLRPKGDLVKSSHGSASGPISFIKVYDAAFGAIAQGGTRRGANMAVLRVDHPDILDFIACKAKEGQLTNFNISVGLTDVFMNAVLNKTDYELVNPHSHSVVKKISATEIFDTIAQCAHRNGEPGVVFLDTANRTNPVPHLYTLEATNPCVPASTIVMTTDGPVMVKNLIDKSFNAVVNGNPDTSTGFFKTGSNVAVFKVCTKEGHSMLLTKSHQVLLNSGKFVEAGLLKEDDKIVLSNNRGFSTWGANTETEFGIGWLLGMLVSDGYFNSENGAIIQAWGPTAPQLMEMAKKYMNMLDPSDPYNSQRTGHYSAKLDKWTICSRRLMLIADQYGISQVKKTIMNNNLLTSSRSLQIGFARGVFDGDGSVQSDHEKGNSIRLSSSTMQHLCLVQKMLLNLGIYSKIYAKRREAGSRPMPGIKEYSCQAQHELCIANDNLGIYNEIVGFHDTKKATRLSACIAAYKRRPNMINFVATFDHLEYAGIEDVYDCTVMTNHMFVADGFVVHNCGEQFLGPFENCCLGSINLSKFADVKTKKVDWESLAETVHTVARFLDDVIESNAYVPSVPKLREAAMRVRRIGVGIMGLADLAYIMRVRYGSRPCLDLSSQIAEFVRYHAMLTSIQLALERGPFPGIKGSIYDPNNMKWVPPTPLQAYESDYGRPKLDWASVVDGIRSHGIRNGAQTTVAPTGTIGTVAGCEGYGCEPVFALAYTRKVHEKDGDVILTYVSPQFVSALNDAGISGDIRQKILDRVLETGSCQDVAELPREIRDTFVVSGDITVREHVNMQASLQRFVDNSISKTVNFPPTATVNDVREAYLTAWHLGCKGLTIYVTGSRQSVVLETKAVADSKAASVVSTTTVPVTTTTTPSTHTSPLRPAIKVTILPESTTTTAIDQQQAQPQPPTIANQVTPPPTEASPSTPPTEPEDEETPRNETTETSKSKEHSFTSTPYLKKRPRPDFLQGFTYRCDTPLGDAYITVNNTEDKEPFEVFLNVGKGGSDVSAVSEALGRLVSLLLRLPSLLSPTERLEQVVSQLEGIGGRKQRGFGKKRISSLPDAIARSLREHIANYSGKAETIGIRIAPSTAATTTTAASMERGGSSLTAAAAAASNVGIDQRKPAGDLCPDCGNSTLLNIEGCRKCYSCGYSEC